MIREEKRKMVDQLAEIISTAKGIYLTDFTGLDVASITELRRRLKEASASYRVVKNTLARLAVEKAGRVELKEFLDGPTGIVHTRSDPLAPAKCLVELVKRNQRPKIKSGFVEGQILKPIDVMSLAALPSKEELLGQVVCGMAAPLTSLLAVLQELPRRLVGTLDALEKRQGDEQA
ncbi:MAG TPA: 50S ribosomal protein L10 [Candidatus Latescibacteria bacterium]|nr:50S ribosomal protein L10 [Candidatus Latescibacterota bacterium]